MLFRSDREGYTLTAPPEINIDMPSYWVLRPSGDNGTLITMEEYEVG
jgi:hypothetical protein